MDLGSAKDIAIILATVVGLTTFFTGALEYARRGHHERAQRFLEMRRRFLETPEFGLIVNKLIAKDESLREVPIRDRRNFLGFLEEVALLANTRVLHPDVADYMFGYYVQLADASTDLWYGLDPTSRYWSVFRRYAHEVKGRAERDGLIRAVKL